MAKITVLDENGADFVYEGNAGLGPGGILIITEKVPDFVDKSGGEKDKMVAMFNVDSWSIVECE